MNTISQDDLFDLIVEYPNEESRAAYDSLVGLDREKERIGKEAALLLDPDLLREWSDRHYNREVEAVRVFRGRAPFLLFVGDVGTGKTVLAKSFADRIVRDRRIDATLFSLSLNSRGEGKVGEMTRLISTAFSEIKNRPNNGATILLVDEADALAQSREYGQMHHEDRAGVDALIRGLDDLAAQMKPVLVVMCTNRGGALDPAVRRRAALIVNFDRPNDENRRVLLSKSLDGLGFEPAQIEELVQATGPTGGREYGFTYSDITNRLIPEIVLDAVPTMPVQPSRALEIGSAMDPTPPFGGASK